MPMPAASAICSNSTGSMARKTQPGKLPEMMRNSTNSVKMMAKFSSALQTTISGRHTRGKLIFFSRLAWSMNMVWARMVISENRFQVSTPAHR